MFSEKLQNDIKELLFDNGIDWQVDVNLVKGIKELIFKYTSEDGNIRALKDQLFTDKNMTEGTNCAVCNQRVKMYLKSIDAETGRCLINLYKLDAINPQREWWHVSSEIKVPFKVSGSFAKMRYWGLIEMRPKKEGEITKKTSGMWRITRKGRDFVLLNVSIPKYVKLYNGIFYGLQAGEDKPNIDMIDVLGDRFNYNELLKR